jgi:two-component system LytT family response regulator
MQKREPKRAMRFALPNQKHSRKKIALSVEGTLVLVFLWEIEFVESHGNWLHIHMGNCVVRIRDSLRSFERRLDSKKFVRLHRSFLVNSEHLKKMAVGPHRHRIITLRSGTEIVLFHSTSQCSLCPKPPESRISLFGVE